MLDGGAHKKAVVGDGVEERQLVVGLIDRAEDVGPVVLLARAERRRREVAYRRSVSLAHALGDWLCALTGIEARQYDDRRNALLLGVLSDVVFALELCRR